MANFPSRLADGTPIRPSQRSFNFGEYPVKTYRALSGKAVRRSFGNRPYGQTLELVFANVNDETVSLIFNHYNEQGGTALGFNLPSDLFSGMDNSAISNFRNPAGTNWYYAESPAVESVVKSVSTISISLVAELN